MTRRSDKPPAPSAGCQTEWRRCGLRRREAPNLAAPGPSPDQQICFIYRYKVFHQKTFIRISPTLLLLLLLLQVSLAALKHIMHESPDNQIFKVLSEFLTSQSDVLLTAQSNFSMKAEKWFQSRRELFLAELRRQRLGKMSRLILNHFKENKSKVMKIQRDGFIWIKPEPFLSDSVFTFLFTSQ